MIRKYTAPFIVLATILLPLYVLISVFPTHSAAPPTPHLGYGFNVNEWDVVQLQGMGFDWIKVFNAPDHRLEVNVLIRVNGDRHSLNNLDGFRQEVSQLATNHGEYIEAYEIGNEPNLDASYGWAAPPIAADYVTLLCEAYSQIKANDPTSIVVSAGLAPTGRVFGNWNGHVGHNGFYQDERAYFQEFLDAGGADCADVFGYHPYGYSANFDAVPDMASGDPTQNCDNGFCFRGVEKIYDILVANGLGNRKIWATEYGWIVEPPAECLTDPTWQGRLWQIVTEQQQATNLAGSFQYADEHMPWMGAMIIFNLNFNEAGHLPLCEQMRFYGVSGRPAEQALTDMPKNPAVFGGELVVDDDPIHFLIGVDEQPISLTTHLTLMNVGFGDVGYELVGSGDLMPAFSPISDTISPHNTAHPTLSITSTNRAVGNYFGEVRVTGGISTTIPVQLHVVSATQKIYLPIILN